MNIMEVLTEILCEYRGEEIVITPETTFDELQMDSLDKVELLMAVEEKFDMQFPDDVQVGSVKELLAIIEKHVK